MTYGEICPYDNKTRFLCRYKECTTLCSWRYNVDGRGGKEIIHDPCNDLTSQWSNTSLKVSFEDAAKTCMGRSTRPKIIGEKRGKANACLVAHHCESCSNKEACDEQEANEPIPIMGKENLGRPQYLAIMRKGECMGCPNYQLKLMKVVVSIEKIERKPVAMTYSYFGERGDKGGKCSICGKIIYGRVDELNVFYDDPEHPSVRDVERCHGRCYEKTYGIDWNMVSLTVDDDHIPKNARDIYMAKLESDARDMGIINPDCIIHQGHIGICRHKYVHCDHAKEEKCPSNCMYLPRKFPCIDGDCEPVSTNNAIEKKLTPVQKTLLEYEEAEA